MIALMQASAGQILRFLGVNQNDVQRAQAERSRPQQSRPAQTPYTEQEIERAVQRYCTSINGSDAQGRRDCVENQRLYCQQMPEESAVCLANQYLPQRPASPARTPR